MKIIDNKVFKMTFEELNNRLSEMVDTLKKEKAENQVYETPKELISEYLKIYYIFCGGRHHRTACNKRNFCEDCYHKSSCYFPNHVCKQVIGCKFYNKEEYEYDI